MKVSSIPAVTIQRAIRKQKAVKEFQALKRAATKIQASVRGQQLRNKQLRNKQLLEAAKIGDISKVENLLDRGADVNVTDKYGNRALNWAAYKGYEDIVKALVIAGADVNVKNKYGMTALLSAASMGYKEIVKALVIAGADIKVTDNTGRTAIKWAKKYGHYYKVKNAIKEGKQKLISLYENQQCQLKTGVNSPIHEYESLREPLLQNKPEKLNETQIQQAIKYRKEKKLGTINSLIKIIFQV